MKKHGNEIIWISVKNSTGDKFYITSKKDDRSTYFIYDSEWKKLGKGRNPNVLVSNYVNP